MPDELTTVKDAVSSAIAETGFVPEPAPIDQLTADPPAEPEKPAVVEKKDDPEPEVVKVGEEKVVEPEKKDEKVPVVEKKDEINEDDYRATAEELDAIEKDPALKKIYRGMVRGYQQKTSAFAEKRKGLEAAAEAIESMRQNPAAAARVMAQAAGLKIVEVDPAAPATPAEKTKIEKIRANLEAKLGKEAADVLGDVLIETVTALNEEALTPVKASLAESEKAKNEQQVKNKIMEFGASVIEQGGEWNKEIDLEMAKLIGQVIPGEGIDLNGFLEILYNTVQARMGKIQRVNREVTRLREAATVAEPVRPARVAPAAAAPSITPGMNEKDATRLAVQQSKNEIAGRR